MPSLRLHHLHCSIVNGTLQALEGVSFHFLILYLEQHCLNIVTRCPCVLAGGHRCQSKGCVCMLCHLQYLCRGPMIMGGKLNVVDELCVIFSVLEGMCASKCYCVSICQHAISSNVR